MLNRLLLLIRHAEVIHLTWQKLLLVDYYPVLSLTDKGWRQAWDVPNMIKEYLLLFFPDFLPYFLNGNFDITCSTTLRAVQTQQPLSFISGVKANFRKDLRGMDIASTYMTATLLRAHFDSGQSWPHIWETHPYCGLENFWQLYSRYCRSFDRVVRSGQSPIKIVFAHGETHWAAESHFNGLPFTADLCDLKMPFCHMKGYII